MLFPAYFCFHISYAEKASCTLEFIQREFFGINPDRGRKGKKGNVAVSKKVLALVQRITECEWNIQHELVDHTQGYFFICQAAQNLAMRTTEMVPLHQVIYTRNYSKAT
ncbi:uncharacterized protein [Dermacentor andersoni]|uniref:uncharacterized protein n=1 Tax=Dermacentor andersoni TaxID=34620 RepID=UPI0021555DEE|nr:uncharacterized protein LOC126519280 [Dermacentor andersoni]